MNNYHTLPCGTPIPPEGIEAWVRIKDYDWMKGKIIAWSAKAICDNGYGGETITEYSLTDPTKPKRRLVTPMELAGKWLRSEKSSRFVCSIIDTEINCFNLSGDIDGMMQLFDGYSDTPTSPIKSFWVEEGV